MSFLCFAIGRRLVFEAMEVRPLFDLPRQHSASPGLRNPEDLSKDISKRKQGFSDKTSPWPMDRL